MIMANQKNELEQVELELSELRSHLEQSFGVLDGLAQVQARFEELARTYQDFKARVGEAGAVLGTVTQQQQKLEQRFSSLEQEISSGWSEIRKELSQIRGEVGEGDRQLNQSITEQVIHLQRLEERFGDVSRNLTNQRDEISTELSRAHEALRNQVEEAKANLETFVQTQGGSDQRLAELEKLIEASWKQARNELLQAQEELSTADRTLSSEMVKQINGLKREVEGRLGTILQEWMNQREAMRAPMEEFEARLRTELRANLTRLREAGLNPASFEKLDKLETQLRAVQSSSQETNKQLRQMSKRLTFTTVIACIALALPVALVALNTDLLPFGNSTSQPDQPDQPTN